MTEGSHKWTVDTNSPNGWALVGRMVGSEAVGFLGRWSWPDTLAGFGQMLSGVGRSSESKARRDSTHNHVQCLQYAG